MGSSHGCGAPFEDLYATIGVDFVEHLGAHLLGSIGLVASARVGAMQGAHSCPRALVHGGPEHTADVPCDARVQDPHAQDLCAHVGRLDEQVLVGDLERLGRERRGEQGLVGLQMHEEVRHGLVRVQGKEERGQAGRREGRGGGKEEVRVVEDDEGG